MPLQQFSEFDTDRINQDIWPGKDGIGQIYESTY